MNILRFLTACALIGSLVLITSTFDFSAKPPQALAAANANPLTSLTAFGGQVITVIPCASKLGPSLHVSILKYTLRGPIPYLLIWTPKTVWRLYGPPVKPGQCVFGLHDIPFVCTIYVGGVPVPLKGFRVTMAGSNLPVKNTCSAVPI